jgi:predicted metal-dependent hydrolase
MNETTKLPKRSSINFGSEKIEFDIATSARATLAISVNPDRSVTVIAPKNADLSRISDRVKKRAPWILKQRIYFSQFLHNLTEKKYVAGESFYYLGRQYKLKITTGSELSIKLTPGVLWLTTVEKPTQDEVKKIITDWYKAKAKAFFHLKLAANLEKFEHFKIKHPDLVVRKMQFRWGSCTKHGLIILNQDLIQAPSHCIDYVICHELTHLRVRNHSPEFFKMLSRVMPDWEMRRRRLEKFVL